MKSEEAFLEHIRSLRRSVEQMARWAKQTEAETLRAIQEREKAAGNTPPWRREE